MKKPHYSIKSVSAATFLAMLFLGAGCAPVDGQPVHDRPLSTPLLMMPHQMFQILSHRPILLLLTKKKIHKFKSL